VKVTYTLSIKSNCPVDLMPDAYDCSIVSDKAIPVEFILETVDKFSGSFEFQEKLAETLSRELCASVSLVGWHSGVKVVVEA
jgi:NADPH-dependent 7-cyano-7-deazaguanine reductase QueF